MDNTLIQILTNYGAMGVMLIWFMFKNSKDMETFKEAIQKENELTREALNDLKVVIAKISPEKGTGTNE